jgi:hypothetical protein
MEKAVAESGARSMSDYMRARIFQARDDYGIHKRLQSLEQGLEMLLKRLDDAREK